MTSRFPGYDIGRDTGGIGKGLVQFFEHSGECVEDILVPKLELMMVGPIEVRHLSRIAGFVKRREIQVTDGECFDGPARIPGHQPDDDAGVDATAQEGAQRNISDEAAFHRCFKESPQFFFASGHRRFFALRTNTDRIALERDIPVFNIGEAVSSHDKIVTGEKLPDVCEDGSGCRNVVQGEIKIQSFHVDFSGHIGVTQNGLDLRCEKEPLPIPEIVKGFNPEAVPGQPQPFSRPVIEPEGKHAIEISEAGKPFLFVEVEKDFAVRVASQPVAFGLYQRCQTFKIVDFSVKHQPQGAVFVAHGLMSGRREINDAEPAVSQTDRGRDQDPFVIGASIGDCLTHFFQQALAHRRTLEI